MPVFGLISRRSRRGIPMGRKIAALVGVLKGEETAIIAVNRELEKEGRPSVDEEKANTIFTGWYSSVVKAGREGDEGVISQCKGAGIACEKELKARKAPKKAPAKKAPPKSE